MSYADVRHHYEDPPSPEEQTADAIESAVDEMDEDDLLAALVA